jgi:hypothetical protein
MVHTKLNVRYGTVWRNMRKLNVACYYMVVSKVGVVLKHLILPNLINNNDCNNIDNQLDATVMVYQQF